MNKISNEELLQFNRLGLIPGPDESEEAFIARAEYCLQLRNQCVENKEDAPLPNCEDSAGSELLLKEAFGITQPLYGIEPTWMPIAFSNYKLAPWHGGCAWIFQANEDSPTGAFMQLRQQFRNIQKYLGIYRRDELIAHELSHVGRMMFEEPQFEELLAYRSSHSKWRRWLGPIIQAPWESLLFMLSLVLLLVFDLYLQFSGEIETYRMLLWAKLIPVGLIVLGIGRVWRRQKAYKECLKHLNDVVKDASTANAVAYRLTDAEINEFARMDSNAIPSHVKEASLSSLRWRLINLAYF